MLNLHICTSNTTKVKNKTIATLERVIEKEVVYRSERHKKHMIENNLSLDPDFFKCDLRNKIFEEEVRKHTKDIRKGLNSLAMSLSEYPLAYPSQVIKHPKDVISFIKSSIAKKELTDNILTFDPTIYKLIEANYIDDSRVTIYINGVYKKCSLEVVNKALSICAKEFYNLYNKVIK